MNALSSLYESLGLQDVQTYLQSGNVVFRTARQSTAKLSADIATGITNKLDLTVPVLVRNAKAWNEMTERNPYAPAHGYDPKYLHVTLLNTRPASARLEELVIPAGIKDECTFGKLEFYLHCPNGYGRTKLTNTYFEKKLGVVCTTRNWKTVTALNKLAAT
jgi:uncharacterized protein (DUF1697 family)